MMGQGFSINGGGGIIPFGALAARACASFKPESKPVPGKSGKLQSSAFEGGADRDVEGNQAADTLFYSAADPSEHYS